MRVSIVATALDGQQPEAKSVINMVHRIHNRNPGYSDFSNMEISKSFGFTNSVAHTATEGATALKLDNEVVHENINEEQNNIVNEQVSSQENEADLSVDLEEIQHNDDSENPSNGLENFAIDEETPNLFDSDAQKDLEEEFTSFEKKENSEEDELEIPAFLRRQKN